MFLIVCSVYDTVSQVFSPPFLQRNVMEAERSFRDACSQGACGKHPDDLRLMRLAVFDDTAGTFQQCTPPVLICSGIPVGYTSDTNSAPIEPAAPVESIPEG